MCSHVVLPLFLGICTSTISVSSLFDFFPNLYHPIHSFLPLVRLFFFPSHHLFLYDSFLRPLLSPLFPFFFSLLFLSSFHTFFLPQNIIRVFLFSFLLSPSFCTSLSRLLPSLYSLNNPFIPSSSNHFLILSSFLLSLLHYFFFSLSIFVFWTCLNIFNRYLHNVYKWTCIHVFQCTCIYIYWTCIGGPNVFWAWKNVFEFALNLVSPVGQRRFQLFQDKFRCQNTA